MAPAPRSATCRARDPHPRACPPLVSRQANPRKLSPPSMQLPKPLLSSRWPLSPPAGLDTARLLVAAAIRALRWIYVGGHPQYRSHVCRMARTHDTKTSIEEADTLIDQLLSDNIDPSEAASYFITPSALYLLTWGCGMLQVLIVPWVYPRPLPYPLLTPYGHTPYTLPPPVAAPVRQNANFFGLISNML